MVERIGQGGSLQREAILAAMKAQARSVDDVRSAADAVSGTATGAPEKTAGTEFARTLKDGLHSVDASIRDAERLPHDLLNGQLSDFAEVAARIKKAELSMRFALEIRNKLVEAYREVMRMPV